MSGTTSRRASKPIGTATRSPLFSLASGGTSDQSRLIPVMPDYELLRSLSKNRGLFNDATSQDAHVSFSFLGFCTRCLGCQEIPEGALPPGSILLPSYLISA